jgi:hypothetical protein
VNPRLILLLDELDGHPTSHMGLPSRETEYRQIQGWYFQLRHRGRVVRRGMRNEPLTRVEIEDLLDAYKP